MCSGEEVVADEFMLESVIVLFVKNKCSNLSDSNNYMPIAIYARFMNVVSLNRLEEATDMSAYILREFIDYYKQ